MVWAGWYAKSNGVLGDDMMTITIIIPLGLMAKMSLAPAGKRLHVNIFIINYNSQ